MEGELPPVCPGDLEELMGLACKCLFSHQRCMMQQFGSRISSVFLLSRG